MILDAYKYNIQDSSHLAQTLFFSHEKTCDWYVVHLPCICRDTDREAGSFTQVKCVRISSLLLARDMMTCNIVPR